VAELPGIMDMIKQAREMSRKLGELRQRLRSETFTASVAGDLVKASVNGDGEPVKIEIDPSLLKPEEKEMLEDLIAAATAQAVRKARERYREELSRLTGGIDVMGMLGLS